MPFGVAAAVGAGVSAVSGIVGGIMQKGAVDKANSNAQAALARASEDVDPWLTAGQGALTQQNALLGLEGPEAADEAFETFRTSPGYEFQLGEGIKAIDQSASAKGILRSGAQMKAVQEFGQGLADSDFGAYYNRLMGLSQGGLEAGRIGSGVAQQSASAYQNAGKQTADIYGNIAKGIGGTANQLLSNPAVGSWFSGGGGSTINSIYDPGYNNAAVLTAFNPASGLPVF